MTISDLAPFIRTLRLRHEDPPPDLSAEEWGPLRSACAARDWEAAWKIAGLRAQGPPALEELYIFASARPHRALGAALGAWSRASKQFAWLQPGSADWGEGWSRIREISEYEPPVVSGGVPLPDGAPP